MHKKFLTFALPVLGAAAIVGSGFSAWTFTSEANTADGITGTISVTPLIEGMSVALNAETFTLTLDQGGLNNTNVSDGISYSISYNTGSTLTATLTWKDYEKLLETNDVTIKYWVVLETKDAAGSSLESSATNLTSWITWNGSYNGTSSAGTISNNGGNYATSTSGTDTYGTWTIEIGSLDSIIYTTNKPAGESGPASHSAMMADLDGKAFNLNVYFDAVITAKTGA